MLLAFGCNKSDNSITPSSTCMPYSILLVGDPLALVYGYDSKGRVVKESTKFSVLNIVYDPKGYYTYRHLIGDPGTVPAPPNYLDIFQVDKNGMITSYVVKLGNNVFKNSMVYDKSGQLVSKIFIRDGAQETVVNYTYENQNLVKVTSVGRTNSTTTIEYYSDYRNDARLMEFILDDGLWESPLNGFYVGKIYGNPTKNLIKRIISDGIIYNFTYEFDGKGRVTKITAQDSTALYKKDVWLITYDC